MAPSPIKGEPFMECVMEEGEGLQEERTPGARKIGLGVLFIHGIGEQPRGGTLLQCGHPLIRWMEDWAGPRGGGCDVVDCQPGSRESDGPSPPHAIVDFRFSAPSEGSAAGSRWILAESWWAGGVQAPPFRVLAGWLLTRGAWTILSQAGKAARNSRGLLLWGWAIPVGYPVAILLALLLQSTVALLAVLAVVPIPPLRDALSSLLLRLTGTLGDCHVVVESPLQRSAAVSRVREDVRWLAGRGCDRIVVVAHSQGAAIAHLALQEEDTGAVRRLVTYGSGLQKVAELASMTRREGLTLGLTYIIPLLLIVLILWPSILALGWPSGAPVVTLIPGTQIPLFETPPSPGPVGWGARMLLFGTGGLLLLLLDRSFRRAKEWTNPWRVPPFARIRWYDFMASADPVPNGPLEVPADTLDAGRPLVSTEVVNHRNPLTDHNSYWDNRDEFIPSVALHLLEELPHDPAGPIDEIRLRMEGARRARRERTVALVILRAVSFALAAQILILTWPGMMWLGYGILASIDTVPFLSGAGEYLREAMDRSAVLAAAALGSQPNLWHETLYSILGSTLPIGTLLLWHLVPGRLCWMALDRWQTGRVLGVAPPGVHPAFRLLALLMFLAVALSGPTGVYLHAMARGAWSLDPLWQSALIVLGIPLAIMGNMGPALVGTIQQFKAEKERKEDGHGPGPSGSTAIHRRPGGR